MAASTEVCGHCPAIRRAGAGIVVCAGLALILLVALALQLTSRIRGAAGVQPRERLEALLPKRASEWIGKDEPLGATETVNQAVLKTLNLDDFVYRRFSRGSRSFTIYAAYWAPGRMPTRLVASHTPDRCWTENGMRCVDMRFRESFRLEGKALLPAEYRAFTGPSGGAPTFVAYWHTVEGKLYDYGERFNAVPHPWLWWKDTIAQATQGSREQLFVRIASETPLEELWREEGFRAVIGKVADWGLWAATP